MSLERQPPVRIVATIIAMASAACQACPAHQDAQPAPQDTLSLPSQSIGDVAIEQDHEDGAHDGVPRWIVDFFGLSERAQAEAFQRLAFTDQVDVALYADALDINMTTPWRFAVARLGRPVVDEIRRKIAEDTSDSFLVRSLDLLRDISFYHYSLRAHKDLLSELQARILAMHGSLLRQNAVEDLRAIRLGKP